MSQDRRRGKRIPLSFKVEVSGIGLDGVPYCDQAAASEVSNRGCQIHLKREIKSGDMLTLRVIRENGATTDPEAPFLYQIVWARKNNGSWVAGLEALEPGNPWHITIPRESVVRH